jgi:hypothetical protein
MKKDFVNPQKKMASIINYKGNGGMSKKVLTLIQIILGISPNSN